MPELFLTTGLSAGPQTIGVVLSLVTAGCWALSPMLFASAGRRIGSFPVVLLRSMLASVILVVLLAAYALVRGGWPERPGGGQVLWLVASGLTGMGIGDVLIYESLILLGVRRTMQIMTLAPVAAVMLGWIWLGERLAMGTLGGIILVLAGTSYAVLAKEENNGTSREPGRVSAGGLVCALIGAVCAGVGAVTARRAYGIGPLDVMVATTVRVSSAAVLLWLVPLGRGHLSKMLVGLRDGFVLRRLLQGTITGPVAGMFCYLMSLKCIEAGLVSTLVAMSPLFVLPMVAVRYRVKIGMDVVAASLVALGGVAMICVR